MKEPYQPRSPVGRLRNDVDSEPLTLRLAPVTLMDLHMMGRMTQSKTLHLRPWYASNTISET